MIISLPAEMMAQVERVRKVEHRTRSELVREALRTYIEARFPAVTPSVEDIRALRRARCEHARSMPWTTHVARSAEKEREGTPERDRARILYDLYPGAHIART